MRISCSIVCFKNPSDQIETLLTCLAVSTIEIEIYILDNSPDPILSEVAQRYGVIYRHFPENLGFGAGHNKAIQAAVTSGSEYHLLANPDIKFNADTVTKLAEFMSQRPDVGAVAPLVLYPDGKVQHLCKLLPTPKDLVFRRFFPQIYIKAGWLKKYELHATGYDNVMAVPSLSGCFILLRCTVLEKIGYFDERFFMYLEDVDLCRRIGKVSKTMFLPATSVIHEYGKGSYRDRKLLLYHIRSAVRYFNKWGWVFDAERRRVNSAALANFKEK